MSQKFAEQLLEHYESLKSAQILEDKTKDQYTDDTVDIHVPKFNKALIKKASTELIATQLFETGTMSGPVEKYPVETYNREEGVTTTEVAEGGHIKQGKTVMSSTTLEAVGFKLRSVLTAESIEDATNAGNMNIVARAIANLGKDIAEEIDKRLIDLMVAGAQAGNVDVDRTGETDPVETSKKLVNAIVDAIQLVKKQNYRPDFILVDPTIFGYLAKNPEFVEAHRYGDNYLQQTGFMGKIRGLEVFESNHMVEDKAVIGKKKTFGVYKVYIPTMLRGPVYDPEYDKETYVVRTRAAMKILVGEALGTVSLVG